MTWSTTADPEAFVAAAGAFLHADPAGNSVMLTVVEAMRERGGFATGESSYRQQRPSRSGASASAGKRSAR